MRSDLPLRVIRQVANEALAAMGSEFAALYSATGRPSIGGPLVHLGPQVRPPSEGTQVREFNL